MRYALIAAWGAILSLVLGGTGFALSPAYIDGGILNWLFPARGDAIAYMGNVIFSVVYGLMIIVGGTACTFATIVLASRYLRDS